MAWNKDINTLMRAEGCAQSFISEVMRIIGNREIEWDDYYYIKKHEVYINITDPNTGNTYRVTVQD